MRLSHLSVVALWTGLATVAGCGGGGFVPVKGTLTVDGKPVANATVQLMPESGGGRDALGTTDSKGAFRLSTNAPGDGVMPGNYRVVVQLASEETTNAVAKTPEEAKLLAPTERSPKRPALMLPAKYSQPDQTVLKHKVPADGDLKLDLKSEKR